MRTIYVLLLYWLVAGWYCGAQASSPVTAFPTPPQQAAPWNLPDQVSDPTGEIKKGVATIFQLGMADPRGCAYRHVTVLEGGKKVEGRGWVLPGPARYVIGWNGLIYPVAEIGGPADLAADIATVEKTGALAEVPFDNYHEETLDKVLSEFVASPRMMRAWAAPYLLLRLGHPIKFASPSPPDFASTAIPAGSPFQLDLNFDSKGYWLIQFALLIRGDGVAAFVDKNDQLAARRLPVFDRVWAEVEKRLPLEGDVYVSDNWGKPMRPKLSTGWRLLLADAQRRLVPTKAPGDSEIAREIATWDTFTHWDWSSPPATIERVAAAGPAAIPLLLDCLENDRRWNRPVVDPVVYGDGHVSLRALSVRDVVICALNRILRFEVLPLPYETESVEEVYGKAAQRMRAFCSQYRNSSGGELWFRILADPNAEADDQFQAAHLIVRGRPNDYTFLMEGGPRAATTAAEGELLRARREPSVSDLLKRAWRKDQLTGAKELADHDRKASIASCCGGTNYQPGAVANRFVRLLDEWQPGNLEVLREHSRWLADAHEQLRKHDPFGAYFLVCVCEETLIRRFEAGDESAMHDYEVLFHVCLPFKKAPIDVMMRNPDRPGMDALAREAFLGEKAPLSLVNEAWRRYDPRERLFSPEGSPLWVLPSFRRALVEALQNKSPQGTLTKDGSVQYIADPPEASAPLPETGPELRLCDVVAHLLTPGRGAMAWVAPRFHLNDPLPDRDRAIEQWIKLLSSPP